ncbi:MAG: hypothetical protein KAI16_00245 [Candidatus Pacebacteria bacterium]|nr:hypothetical protein [Candidatus Paceibacterota bacterium]
MIKKDEKIELKLNYGGVTNSLYDKLRKCNDSVTFGLQTLELINEIPPELEIDSSFLKMKMGENDIDICAKKQKYKDWLLERGFEDLMKGVEYTLRDAYKYSYIISNPIKFTKLKNLNDFQKKAEFCTISSMIEKIKFFSIKDLVYVEHILSINKVRNCLVHRGGIVGEKDINNKNLKILELKWIKMKLFYKNNKSEEVDIVGGTKIQNVGHSGALVLLKKDEKIKNFKKGEKISFDYKQFNEIISTCFLFGEDLKNCLPKKIKT